MKVARISSLLVIFLLSAAAVFAQDNVPTAGVLVGFNHSGFSTQPESDTNAKQGVMLGAFAVLNRESRFLKIQPELQFSQRRVEAVYSGAGYSYTTSYLNASLLVRMNLYKGWYTTQGPQFAFPVRASLRTPAGTLDVKDNIASDFSLIVGVGHQFNTRIGIEGRYDAGLKRVEELPLGNFVKRNTAWTFMAVVGF